MSVFYGDDEDQPTRTEREAFTFTNSFMFGRGFERDTILNDWQHMDMRTRVKTKSGAQATYLLRALDELKISRTGAAEKLVNTMQRQFVSLEGEGRKEGTAVLLGSPKMMPGQGTIQGYMDVLPPEWVQKAAEKK